MDKKQILKMATATTISLSDHDYQLFDQRQLDVKAATKASEVLQENHKTHHVLYSPVGLHVRLHPIWLI